jgi:hypothetical protein
MKRLLLGVALVLLIVGGVAVWRLYSSLDSIVKSAIESYGSELTGTPVRVSAVSIAATSGRGTVRGLRVANPPGFSAGEAFGLGEITLQLDIRSLTGGPVVVEELLIDGPYVRYELDERGASNFGVIRKRFESSPDSSSEPATEDDGTERTRLVIRKFVFKNGLIEIDPTALGEDKMTERLPTVRMENIGGRTGIRPARLGRTLLIAFGSAVTRTVASKGVESYIDQHLKGGNGAAAKAALRSLLQDQ